MNKFDKVCRQILKEWTVNPQSAPWNQVEADDREWMIRYIEDSSYIKDYLEEWRDELTENVKSEFESDPILQSMTQLKNDFMKLYKRSKELAPRRGNVDDLIDYMEDLTNFASNPEFKKHSRDVAQDILNVYGDFREDAISWAEKDGSLYL